MPRLYRRLPPFVVTTIRMTHGRLDQILRIDVVETRELDGHVISADFLHMTALEGAHAAGLAEEMLALPAAESIFTERIFTGEETERCRLDDRVPVARLRADGAVALVG